MSFNPADPVPRFAPSQGGCAECGHLYGTNHRDGPCSACGCTGFRDGARLPIAWALLVLAIALAGFLAWLALS